MYYHLRAQLPQRGFILSTSNPSSTTPPNPMLVALEEDRV